MIVFTSDHGMAFAGGKTTVYEEVYGYRLWFVIPTRKKRGRSTAMISHIDITPTLLDFAGALDHQNNRPMSWEDPKNLSPFLKRKPPRITGGNR